MTIDPAGPLGRLTSALTTYRDSLDTLPVPPFQRPEGLDDSEWRARIEAARAAHDQFAIDLRDIVDEVSATLSGVVTSRLPPLPESAQPARTTHASVPVSTRRTLRDILPNAQHVRLPESAPPPFPHPDLVDVPIRIHRSVEAEPGPCIISMHGGAFWMGGGAVGHELDAPLGAWLAQAVRGTVIDVDYRLAPEHPYPASIIDLITVLDWVRSHADELNVDRARLAVLGVSSGGNVAAIGAIVDAARDIDFPPLAAQVLIVPSLNLAEVTPEQSTSTAGLKARQSQILGYLGDAIDPAEPLVSPVLGAPTTGLAAAIIVTAEFDEVALGGKEWVDCLRSDGIPVTHLRYPMTHTISTPETSARMVSDLVEALSIFLEPAPIRRKAVPRQMLSSPLPGAPTNCGAVSPPPSAGCVR